MKLNALLPAFALAASLVSGAALAQTTTQTDATPSDGAFISTAISSGLAEVNEAQLALQRSHNPAVLAFARRMEKDHSLANSQFKALAETKNYPYSSDLAAADKTKMSQLSALSSAAFDRAYASGEVTDHEQAVALFQKESSAGGDLDVRSLAARTLPTLQDHLKMAQSLAAQLR